MIIQSQAVNVEVELAGTLTRGQTGTTTRAHFYSYTQFK